MDTANSILDDNIWKWELTSEDEKRLKEIASPKTLGKYNSEKSKNTASQLVKKFENTEKPKDIINLIQQLSNKKIADDIIWWFLEKSKVIDRADIDEWIFFDDFDYNKIEDIIWTRPNRAMLNKILTNNF